MDERPSFRRRADVRRLVFALMTPWAFFAVAYSLPLLSGVLYLAGFSPDWLGSVVMFWFYPPGAGDPTPPQFSWSLHDQPPAFD